MYLLIERITVIGTTAGAGLLMGLLREFNKRGVANTRHNPAARPAKNSFDRLGKNYVEVAKNQGITVDPKDLKVQTNVPPSDLGMTEDLSPYASNGVDTNSGKYSIRINPEADEVNFAHELGHVISRQTDVGRVVRDLRDNPKLKTALLGAMMTVPGFAAALEEGDNDMDTSMALAIAAASPAILDETGANINAIRMMNYADNGPRMSRGQIGRMAGGYLSYLAAPMLAGAAGNLVGNQLD